MAPLSILFLFIGLAKTSKKLFCPFLSSSANGSDLSQTLDLEKLR